MKKLILLLSVFLPMMALAHMGTDQGNGGDPQEAVFKEIAGNIAAWIKAGNSEGLILGGRITHEAYIKNMTRVLSNYDVSFTDQIVTVDNIEKTCKNRIDSKQSSKILCNIKRFSESTTEDKYRLVHHEFAGLAGFETTGSNGANYDISNQISGFLRNEQVLRLPVAKGAMYASSGADKVSCVSNFVRRLGMSGQEAMGSCNLRSDVKFQTCVINLGVSSGVENLIAVASCLSYRSDEQFQSCVNNLTRSLGVYVNAPVACQKRSDITFQNCVIQLRYSTGVESDVAVEACVDVPTVKNDKFNAGPGLRKSLND